MKRESWISTCGVAACFAMATSTAGAAVLDEGFASWPATGWTWNATTTNGANWAAPASDGSALGLSVTAGSGGYDEGTLLYSSGIETYADGTPGNAAGQVEVSFKYKWNAQGMRMYPRVELANGPTSDDFLRWQFLTGESGGVATQGRFGYALNGLINETNYNDPLEFKQPDTYGYARFWLDMDARLARWFVSDDGVTWDQMREVNMSAPAFDVFFNGTTTLYPRISMVVRDDSPAGSADFSLDVDRVWANAVPEPASLALLAGGVTGLVLRRRR